MNEKIIVKKCFTFSLYAGAFIGVLTGILTALEVLLYRIVYSPSIEEEIFILACIIAPITEEILKPIGLILCRRHAKHLHLKDWVVMGALAGVGFAIFENAIYYMSALTRGGELFAIATVLIRTFTTLPMHVLTSSISGLGLGFWFSRGKYIVLPGFYVAAIAIHSAFNFAIIGTYLA